MATHSCILCLEKSHGQGSLEGYSPWGCKESDTTEHAGKKKKIEDQKHFGLLPHPLFISVHEMK